MNRFLTLDAASEARATVAANAALWIAATKRDAMSARWDRQWIGLKQPLRLALVADDPSAHHALRRQLSGPDAAWRVEVHPDAASALRDIPASPPHVVLMEVALPDLPGIECTTKLKAAVLDLPVVFYTARAEARTVLEAMMAGASGYLIKPLASAELVLRLRKAVMGGLALCARAERLLLESLRGLGGAGTRLGLSWREEDLMLCLCQRRSHKECAAVLGISEATVHAHLARVYKKLHVHDRESAVRLFMGHFPGGGGGEMAAKAVGRIRPFLDLLRYCHSGPSRYKWMQKTVLNRQS